MLDDMFPFIDRITDPIIDPIMEMSENDTTVIIQLEAFLDFLKKYGLDKEARSPEGTTIKVPLDIALSLLQPDELEKLKNYIAFYLEKYGSD